MFDKKLVLEILSHIEESLTLLIDSTGHIETVDELLDSPQGVLMLDGICMRLMAVGEEIKKLDKITDKTLLVDYPSIPWRSIMGIRDIIAHHYFEVDADRVFDVLRNNLPPLLAEIKKMTVDFG